MADLSKCNRTTISDCGNIRDIEDADDNEFFAAAMEPDESGVEEACKLSSDYRQSDNTRNPENVTVATNSTSMTFPPNPSSSIQLASLAQCLPVSGSSDSLRRFPSSTPSNLSKISEVPDELSFSFKHGENALRLINEDHEKYEQANFLRLPSGSFHASRYSLKYSWEESALRCQNSLIRSELDLSRLKIEKKTDGSSQTEEHSPESPLESRKDSLQQTCSNIKDGQNSSCKQQSSFLPAQHEILTSSRNKSITALRSPFISGTRYSIYFGFRRADGLDSEEVLRIHNIHPDRERLRVYCWLKKNNDADNYFKLCSPKTRVPIIMEWDTYQKIVISFTPTTIDHFQNYLYVKCQSRTDVQKFSFLVHGFGGRAIVCPCIEDRSANLLVSTNGRYQLIVNSAAKFHFGLKNNGNRSAFASIFIHGRNGELPHHEAMVNRRNVILDKKGLAGSNMMIEVRYLGSHRATSQQAQQQQQLSKHRQSNQSSVISASNTSAAREESFMQIIIFWGEERQRQRLKQLEKSLGCQLMTFGYNFTKLLNFYGEGVKWTDENVERHVSEEEFYYFDANVKLIFIDVHEKKSFDRMMGSCSSSGGSVQPEPQLRIGSSLSVASSSGTENTRRSRLQQQARIVVERDPDNTMVGAGSAHDATDDTLTQF